MKSKRIGILTFHRAINYGAFLQCYSLSEKIKKEFPMVDIEVIDYTSPKERFKMYKNILRSGYHNGFQNMIREVEKNIVFVRSLKELPLSKCSYNTSNIKELFRNIDNNYDIIIAGSDAIFNWDQNGFPSAYYLNYNFGGHILSYAASVHGMKFKEITDIQKQYCAQAFSRFSFLGVRDSNTENFVRYCNSKFEPVHTCDPTFFIDLDRVKALAGNYRARISKQYKVNFSKPIIAIMLLDENINKTIKERYGRDFQIVSLFKTSKYVDVFLNDLNPFEWASFLSDVSIVFTQYFHGTLLTLKNNKPVIVIDCSNYSGEYEAKLKDLIMKRLNLHELYFIREQLSHSSNHNRMFDIAEQAINHHYDERIRESMRIEADYVKPLINHLNMIL